MKGRGRVWDSVEDSVVELRPTVPLSDKISFVLPTHSHSFLPTQLQREPRVVVERVMRFLGHEPQEMTGAARMMEPEGGGGTKGRRRGGGDTVVTGSGEDREGVRTRVVGDQ